MMARVEQIMLIEQVVKDLWAEMAKLKEENAYLKAQNRMLAAELAGDEEEN